MDTNQILHLILQHRDIRDPSAAEVYITMITSYHTTEVYTERHHILPKADTMWPEFQNETWNVIRLSAFDHFVCHYWLARALGGKMVFALNQMNRLKKKFSDCELSTAAAMYQEFREELANKISAQNTGWFDRLTESEQASLKSKKSTINKGKAAYRYPDGTCHQLSTSHPDVISGKATHVCVGQTHSDETKTKMSVSSKSGKNGWERAWNPSTSESKYFEIGTVPEGWILGCPSKPAKGKTKAPWCYNQQTGHLSREFELPEGYIWGRPACKFKEGIRTLFGPNGLKLTISSKESPPAFFAPHNSRGIFVILSKDNTRTICGTNVAALSSASGFTKNFIQMAFADGHYTDLGWKLLTPTEAAIQLDPSCWVSKLLS